MFRAIVLEDNPQTQHYLEHVLNSIENIRVTGMFDSVEKAKRFCSQYPIDIAIIDLGLPDGSGCELINLLNKKQPSAKKLISTIFDDEETFLNSFKLGVNGYILKDTNQAEIISAIESCLSGDAFIHSSVARYLVEYFKQEQQLKNNNGELKLSRRESDVLRLISKGYSYSKVAETLNIRYNTASSYIKNLYAKLDAKSKNEAVYIGITRGLVQVEDIQ